MPDLAPSREVLEQQDHEAWQKYARLCFDPLASSEQKLQAFKLALDSTMTVLDHDRLETG